MKRKVCPGMNAFTEMRKSYFESNGGESFAEYYLAHRCYVSEADDDARFALKGEIASVRALCQSDAIREDDILSLLGDLGENLFLDRYRVELLIRQKALLTNRTIQKALVEMLCDATILPQKMMHLLDICIECDLPLLSLDHLQRALIRYRSDYDVFSLLLEYVLRFSIHGLSELLYGYLTEDLPKSIQLQLIDLLFSCNPNPFDPADTLRQKLISEPQFGLYQAYLNLHQVKMYMEACGIVVVQPMFYGDPEESGKGKSGGLGTLLKTLGSHLSKQEQIAQVITLTLNQDWDEQKSFLHPYEQGHWLVRLPVYSNPEDPHAFVRRELPIKRAIARFFHQRQIEPDLFHIRYLDNASRAMAQLSKEMHAKLVFTLTPDPHRNMVDARGDILCYKVPETLEKLNKITIGDELLTMTDGIVGIGGETVKEELELYFPQLQRAQHPTPLRMLGEGIDTHFKARELDVWQFIERHALDYRILRQEQNRPVMLNVGRLSRQKGQHHLLKAWGESRLWQDFDLIVIGGSRDSKDEEERIVKAHFAEFMEQNPHLIGRFAHLEALPNEDIRLLERTLMEQETEWYPNLYVCSSIKEEFGISILEALSEGFLTFAPIRGGVKTYLTSGETGFLIDTTDAATLRKDLEHTLYDAHMQRADFKKIQHAGQRTVLDAFTIEEIAKRLMEWYLGLSGTGELLCVSNKPLL